MARDQRDIVGPEFTVTNSEVVTSFDANTATLTVTSNAVAYLFQELINQGILKGTVSS